MGNPFNSNYFIFDGKNSYQYGYKMVMIGSSNSSSLFGLDRSVNKEDGIKDIDIFKGIKNNYISTSIQLAKVKGNKMIEFTDEDLSFVTRWLFKNTPKSFEFGNGLLTYAIFKKGGGQFLAGGNYLELEMEISPTAYTPIAILNDVIKNSKTVEVKNITTINENTPIDFEVSMIEGNNFSLTNLMTGKKFEINGMDNNEEFYVYGERHYVECKTNSKKNIYKLCNKVFDLDLVYGKNKLRIECDKAQVTILYQSKMAYQ